MIECRVCVHTRAHTITNKRMAKRNGLIDSINSPNTFTRMKLCCALAQLSHTNTHYLHGLHHTRTHISIKALKCYWIKQMTRQFHSLRIKRIVRRRTNSKTFWNFCKDFLPKKLLINRIEQTNTHTPDEVISCPVCIARTPHASFICFVNLHCSLFSIHHNSIEHFTERKHA